MSSPGNRIAGNDTEQAIGMRLSRPHCGLRDFRHTADRAGRVCGVGRDR
jgi:hypothetical protein